MELLRVKVIVGHFSFLGNHINKGEILTVRRMGIGYQVVVGKHTGRIVEANKVIELTKGKTISFAEWVEMEQEYLSIIKELKKENKDLKEKCATHEKDKELNEFLLQTTAKALMRIDEFVREKETAERMS